MLSGRNKSRHLAELTRFGVVGLTLALACNAAQGQFNARGLRSTIEGSVLIDGESQPAAKVRVDVKALGGATMASTFTDSSGRFEAPAEGGDAFIVSVQQQGYEPAEQRVNLEVGSGTPGIVITLHKVRPIPADGEGYFVSVHDLKVPGKARRAYDKGLALLQKKDFEGSLARFKEATDDFPNYYEAYYQIGLANLELRRGDAAEHALQRAIDLSGGGYVNAEFALGALLVDRKDYVNAERVLRRAIDVDASSWKGHMFLGQALFGQNRLAEAEKSVREVLLRRPDLPSAYILMANIHIKRQEFVLGIKYLDTFLSMKPTGPTSDQARAVRAAAEQVMTRLQATVTAPQLAY
jgi:tetratricopeptide (TPR) repeat protein